MSDELLARYAARGSKRAFAVLYERYHQPLYRYCRSIVNNEADAQDALQTTFTGALAALQRDARSAPLRPWLYRIAHNESISLLRRRKRDAHQEVLTESTAVGSSTEEEAAGRARWRRLVNDLAELPERQRGALLLRELAGLSHEDIAVALGLTVGGAKQAIFEARQGLAEVEEGRAMSCEEVRLRISEGDRRVLRGRRVRAHLGECASCEAFAMAIPARQAELRALTPVLTPVAAAAVLGRALSAASLHGGASATAGSAAAAGTVGKAASTVVGWKLLAGAAVLVTTAAGVTGLTHVLRHHHRTPTQVLQTRSEAGDLVVGHASARHASATPGIARSGADSRSVVRATPNRTANGHSQKGLAHSRGAASSTTGKSHVGQSSAGGAAVGGSQAASHAPSHGTTSHTHASVGHGRASGRGSPNRRSPAGTRTHVTKRPSPASLKSLTPPASLTVQSPSLAPPPPVKGPGHSDQK